MRAQNTKAFQSAAMGIFSMFMVALAAVFLSAGAGLAASEEKDAASKDAAASDTASAPPPVTVSVAKERSFENSVGFSGRVEAIETVDLMARVQGYLSERKFEEGTVVAADDLLFQLDDRTYANALHQAEAALKVSEAQRVLAEQKFARQTELTERNVQSRAALEEAQANLDVSFANVQAAKARVEEAQINLDFTKIIAPFTGRIGRAYVSTGDLINPQSGTMATIVQVDPIYVTFPVPQGILLNVQEQGASSDDVKVELTLANGSTYEHKGMISFAEVSATSSTDSVLVRATVPNPDGTLIDKAVVDVKVVADEDDKVLSIPQQALLIDQQGAYVLIVDDDDKVQQVRIETGGQQGVYLEVKSGLKEGARVIIDGIQKTSPGEKVAPSAAQESN